MGEKNKHFVTKSERRNMCRTKSGFHLMPHQSGKICFHINIWHFLTLIVMRNNSKWTFITLWAKSADEKLMICFLFFQSPQEAICLKCQSLFSGKNKKNTSNCRLLKFLPSMLSVNSTPSPSSVRVIKNSSKKKKKKKKKKIIKLLRELFCVVFNEHSKRRTRADIVDLDQTPPARSDQSLYYLPLIYQF